jgi:type II secretory pathway pseudopilin PulG
MSALCCFKPKTGLGFSLIELTLSLGILGLMGLSAPPLFKIWQSEKLRTREMNVMESAMHHIEAYAITHRRLPCPASDSNGLENVQSAHGVCLQETGKLPWRTLGLAPPSPVPIFAVASLNTLGAPYAQILTTGGAVRTVNLDALSSAIFAGPDLSGDNSSALPALLVCDAPPINNACPQNRYLSLSAVALVALPTPEDQVSEVENQNNDRFFVGPTNIAFSHRLRWLTYEKLAWLYLKSGVLGSL